MAIDPSAIGAVTAPKVYEWTDRDTLLYALGVGAGTDDIAFTTENSHDVPQQVLPTFAVICCMAKHRTLAGVAVALAAAPRRRGLE